MKTNNYKNKICYNKKAQISTQTVFFVLMMFLMIAILIYGINKIYFVNETLLEQERLEVKKGLEETLNFCDDPLNKGANKNYDFSNQNSFNVVCIIPAGSNLDSLNLDSSLKEEIEILSSTGENIFLIKSEINEDNGNLELVDSQIIDSLKIETEFDSSSCSFEKIKIICS